jgi:hypothetical protein
LVELGEFYPCIIYLSRCDRYLECNEILCGLSLFKGLDESVFEKLLEDIQQVRSRGVIVKLAFGGEQWGNIKVPTMVSKKELTLKSSVDLFFINDIR